MQLRPHQTEALQSMADNDLGQVIVPTGGGKTMCTVSYTHLTLPTTFGV